MKRLFSLMLVLITAYAFAQTPAGPPPGKHQGPKKSPEERATMMTDHLEKELTLTKEQKPVVHSLVLTKEQKMEELRNSKSTKDSTAMKAERKKIMDEFQDGMKKTLTPDQFTKWEAQKKQHRGEGPPPPPPTPEQKAKGFSDHMEKEFGLNADQKTKVHDLALAHNQKMMELRKANRGKDPCDWSDQRKQAQTEFDNGIKSTLTPEQYSKWQAKKEARAKGENHHTQQHQKH
ncbi:hypothetical protein BH09BAC5_BH09BAC5_28970 [soil metagenome]